MTLKIGSAAADPRRLLLQESEAMRTGDAINAGATYVVRKAHRKLASVRRSKSVLCVLCEKGMPAVLMVTSTATWYEWSKVRGKSTACLTNAFAEQMEHQALAVACLICKASVGKKKARS